MNMCQILHVFLVTQVSLSSLYLYMEWFTSFHDELLPLGLFLNFESLKICSISLTGKAAEWTEEELEQTAEAVGYGAVK